MSKSYTHQNQVDGAARVRTLLTDGTPLHVAVLSAYCAQNGNVRYRVSFLAADRDGDIYSPIWAFACATGLRLYGGGDRPRYVIVGDGGGALDAVRRIAVRADLVDSFDAAQDMIVEAFL